MWDGTYDTLASPKNRWAWKCSSQAVEAEQTREPEPFTYSAGDSPRAFESPDRIQATGRVAALHRSLAIRSLNMCTKFDYEGLYRLNRYNKESVYQVSRMTATKVPVVVGNRLDSNHHQGPFQKQ